MRRANLISICFRTSGRPNHIVFYAFDVLIHKGHDLKRLPLSERRAVLATASEPSDHVGLSHVSDETAARMVNFVRSHGLEGVVAKKADSVHEAGLRTGVWTKTRINLGQEFVIGGYIPSHLGVDSIAVGFHRGRISIMQRACGQVLCLPRGVRCSMRSSI
jgi:bifunctional non-homologous end joining protein LigD